MDANHADMLARVQAKTDATLKIIAEIRAWRKETTACQEATEACLEPTLVDFVAVHEEVPREEETFIALRDRYGIGI
jgi:hypothetical protein